MRPTIHKNMFKDYYAILGISSDAKDEEIKKAFRTLAMQWHPDKVPQERKQEAEEKFKEINEAYHVLIDRRRRRYYDTTGTLHEDMFADLYRAMDEMRKSMEDFLAQMEQHFNLMERHFDVIGDAFKETEIVARIFLRIIVVFCAIYIAFATLNLTKITGLWMYIIGFAIPSVCYAINVIVETIIVKDLPIPPGKEIILFVRILRRKFKKPPKTTEIMKR